MHLYSASTAATRRYYLLVPVWVIELFPGPIRAAQTEAAVRSEAPTVEERALRPRRGPGCQPARGALTLCRPERLREPRYTAA